MGILDLVTAEAEGVSVPTLIGLGTATAAALSTAVGVLWKKGEDADRKNMEKSAQVEERNQKLNDDLLGLTKEVGEMRGRYEGITQMCESTLRTVDEAIRGPKDKQ